MSTDGVTFTEEELRRRIASRSEALIADIQLRLMNSGFFDDEKLRLESEIAIDGVVLYTKESEDALVAELGRLSAIILSQTVEAVVATMFSEG